MSSRQAGNHLRTAVLRLTLLLTIFAAVFIFRASCVFAEDPVPVLTVKVDGTVVKEYYNVDEITAIPDALTGPLTFAGYNTYPTLKKESVDEAVRVDKIIIDATGNDPISYGANSVITFKAFNYPAVFTVGQVFGTGRYYYPNISEGATKSGGRSPASAYRDAIPVPVIFSSPDDPENSQLMYGQTAPNEQNWSGFVYGMLDNGLIEISTETAPKCENVTDVTPADESVIADGATIRLPITIVSVDKRMRTHYIVDPANGEVPGDGYDLYFYSPYRWSSKPEKNEQYTNPPVIAGVGAHTLAVKTSIYGKRDSDVSVFRYYVAPYTPQGLSAVTSNYNTVNLAWNKEDGVSGYNLYRKENGGSVKLIKSLGPQVASFTDKGLKTGTKYSYRITAFVNRSTGSPLESAPSSWAVAQPKLGKPAVKLKTGKKKITLKWKKVAGANGYVVYRSLKKTTGFKTVRTIKKGTTLTFTNKKLKKGKRYYYKIRAYRTVGGKRVYSGYSVVKSARAK